MAKCHTLHLKKKGRVRYISCTDSWQFCWKLQFFMSKMRCKAFTGTTFSALYTQWWCTARPMANLCICHFVSFHMTWYMMMTFTTWNVACVYEEEWWIDIILEIDKEQDNVQVNFLHPHCPSQSFHWPHVDANCWFPITHILCTVEVTTTATGRQYNLRHQDGEKQLMLAFLFIGIPSVFYGIRSYIFYDTFFNLI